MLHSCWNTVKLNLEPYRLPRQKLKPHKPAKSALVYAALVALGVPVALGCVLALYRYHESGLLGMHGPFSVSMVDPDPVSQEENIAQKTVISRVLPALPPIIRTEAPRQVLNLSPDMPDLAWTAGELAASHDVFDDADTGTLMSNPQVVKRSNLRPRVRPKTVLGGAPGNPEASTSAPQALEASLPPYPASARSAGQVGVVKVLISVDQCGSVSGVSLSESSGYASLDRAALEWVKNNWSFRPAVRGGIPIASQIIAPIRFKLD